MQNAASAIPIVKGEGSWLYLEDGSKIFDGISSWWVTVHGHAHPHIAAAISAQAAQLEQVIFAGFTHPEAVRLAERLIQKLPSNQKRIFYSDDGSTAVEVALKMAFQYWQNLGQKRQYIAAFEAAYHGDTFGAMSVSGRSSFTKAFSSQLFNVCHVPDPSDTSIEVVIEKLAQIHRQMPLAALIVEPLIMGAGGMRMYNPKDLEALMAWCKTNQVLVIFDEVMTGFYRTGKLFAASHLILEPDIMCLSKGLTGGFLPLSVTSCTNEIYDAFLSEDRSKMLFHGHSFTANPIGCAAANASLDLFEMEETQAAISNITAMQSEAVQRFSQFPQLENVRSFGTILAMNLIGESGYLADSGKEIAKKMLQKGFFIRPLGNVIYLMPPYSTNPEELRSLHDALAEVFTD